LEARYCHEKGIPRSEFLARWTPEDRAIVAAVAMEDASSCGLCGTSAWEWEEDMFAYEAVHVTCPGCQKRELMSVDNDTMPKGTSVRLVPRAMAERLQAETERKTAEGTLRPRRRRE
jgi:hypothetical protein